MSMLYQGKLESGKKGATHFRACAHLSSFTLETTDALLAPLITHTRGAVDRGGRRRMGGERREEEIEKRGQLMCVRGEKP